MRNKNKTKLNETITKSKQNKAKQTIVNEIKQSISDFCKAAKGPE